MIAVDTNILVYAHRADAPLHKAARHSVEKLAESGEPWALPWPVIHEFLAIVTHPKIYRPGTPMPMALNQIDNLLACPTVRLLSEQAAYWQKLTRLLGTGDVRGPKVHDARIAALCLAHGVTRLWTADRDFSAFNISTNNPLSA